MRISCHYGDFDMGYIYLTPPGKEFDVNKYDNHEIDERFEPDAMRIPYTVGDASITNNLDQMSIAHEKFITDYRKAFESEYGLDFDQHGYITGIELNLPKQKFIEMIHNHAYQVIQAEWKEKTFHIVTLDYSEQVFHPENMIYKMTNREDAFVIAQLVPSETLGIYYSTTPNPPIVLFKALITARDDLYPLEYLLSPQFYLKEDIMLRL